MGKARGKSQSKQFTDSINSYYATRRLKELGLTDAQLLLCHFLRNHMTSPFNEWPFTWDPSIDESIERSAIPFIRPYLTYRWVTQDAPPDDPNTSDAWIELGLLQTDSDLQMAARLKEVQRMKSKGPRKRNYILSLEMTMAQLVQNFSEEHEISEMRHADAWRPFFAYLDKCDLDPEEINESYKYNSGGDSRGSISFKQFKRLLRIARAKMHVAG